MGCRRRALAQHACLLVQLESRPFKVLDHPLGELVAGIVGRMFSKEPAEQVPAAGQGEADREHELGTERAVIHQGCSCSVLRRM